MKRAVSLKIAIAFLFDCSISQAQVSTVLNGIKFNESLLEIQKKVKVISDDIRLIKIAEPSFPLSEKQEEHLIALRVKVNNKTIDKVVFTFSDDKLSLIEAKGNVIEGLTSDLKSEFITYLDYRIYNSELLFINIKNDVAWLLTPETVYLNLFTWYNPYLSSNDSGDTKYNQSVKTPGFITMGGNIDVLMPLLKNNSTLTTVEKLEETDSVSNTQVNCFGVEYAGFPRKFEARFKNNLLNMVWIITGKAEENRIRQKLTEEYGNAEFINENWEVFNKWTVLLRKDKSEILLLTKELGLIYKDQLTK